MSVSSQLSAVDVSPEQRQRFHQIVEAIVDQTTAQFQQLVGDKPGDFHRRSVDKSRWKPFKSHQRVQIYRSRERFHPTVFTGASDSAAPHRPHADWTPVAKLLCVGTILGTLDDALYGGATPTELAMATRSLYIQDEFTEHHVLHDIVRPTSDEPFQYFGIKLVGRASKIPALVKPRDTLYLEASGFRHVQLHAGASSERVGYVVYHSIELPEMVRPRSDGVVRARVSACYLFRQAAPGIVELYATLTSDAGGNLPTKLAALSGATVMISVSRVTECAIKKKLAWMLTRQRREPPSPREIEPRSRLNSSASCGQCARSLSGFRSLGECAICRVLVCSRCITTRKLILGGSKFQLRRKTVAVCKRCISVAKQVDNAAEIAAYEYARGSRERSRLNSSTASVDVDLHASSHSSRPLSASSRSLRDERPPLVPTPKVESPAQLPFAARATQTLPARWATQQTPQPNAKMQWWMRINELRLQAEETYQLAKEQTKVMQHAAARSRSS